MQDATKTTPAPATRKPAAKGKKGKPSPAVTPLYEPAPLSMEESMIEVRRNLGRVVTAQEGIDATFHLQSRKFRAQVDLYEESGKPAESQELQFAILPRAGEVVTARLKSEPRKFMVALVVHPEDPLGKFHLMAAIIPKDADGNAQVAVNLNMLRNPAASGSVCTSSEPLNWAKK